MPVVIENGRLAFGVTRPFPLTLTSALLVELHVASDPERSHAAFGKPAFESVLSRHPLALRPKRWGSRLALTVMGFGSALFVALTGVVGWAALSVAETVAVRLLHPSPVSCTPGVCQQK